MEESAVTLLMYYFSTGKLLISHILSKKVIRQMKLNIQKKAISEKDNFILRLIHTCTQYLCFLENLCFLEYNIVIK